MGTVTSVATPSNSSRALDASQILLTLPCVFRRVTGLRVWKMKTKVKCCQAHVQSYFSCRSRQCCSVVEPLELPTALSRKWTAPTSEQCGFCGIGVRHGGSEEGMYATFFVFVLVLCVQVLSSNFLFFFFYSFLFSVFFCFVF